MARSARLTSLALFAALGSVVAVPGARAYSGASFRLRSRHAGTAAEAGSLDPLPLPPSPIREVQGQCCTLPGQLRSPVIPRRLAGAVGCRLLGRSTPINADDSHSDTGPCRRRGALIFLPV